MDGDDEFIGKYAFQVMNAAYQQDPELWVAYSNYKTSSYDFGRSIPFTSEFEHMSPDRKRLFVSDSEQKRIGLIGFLLGKIQQHACHADKH